MDTLRLRGRTVQKASVAKSVSILSAIFLIALIPRLYSAQTVGWNWYDPGTFTPVNYDEANACRSWLDAAQSYSPFLGAQTVSLASVLGHSPPTEANGNYSIAKSYCLSAPHMLTARSLSAVLGAATAVLLGIIGLVLAPSRPQIGWTAGLLLALSGFHATQSHMATVDAPMTFYVYAFILATMLAVRDRAILPILLSITLLLPAMYAKKIWPFPLLAYMAFLPAILWQVTFKGIGKGWLTLIAVTGLLAAALAFNPGFQDTGWYPLLGLFYLSVPWRRVRPWATPVLIALPIVLWWLAQLDGYWIKTFTTGHLASRFGTGFEAIGWNKLERNLFNFPVLLVMSLGIPAALLVPKGLALVFRDEKNIRLWLCLLPILAWAAYMLAIAPRTTYRHYLPLVPAAALLASYAYWSLRTARNPLMLCLFFLWPALLQLDFQLDFHNDTRRQAVQWYRDNPNTKLYTSFYTLPAPSHTPRPALFKEEYAMGAAGTLRHADFLVLSENWYDTSEAQELNGLRVTNLQRLIKTSPEKAVLYRDIQAGLHPNLRLETAFEVSNFMPELILHKAYYGTFQKFVGDLKIYRIVP